jgi:predicted esterase
MMSIPMPTGRAEQYAFTASLQCRYLVNIPEDPGSNPQLVIALHGYSSNPEDMLRLARIAVGNERIIASIQAPNQHYVTLGLPEGRPASGYNWGISQHWDSSVHLHHEMVLTVLGILRERFQVGPEQCALLGFSQPVGLNYRFAATYPEQVRGVIGICGGVPRDWSEPKYKPVRAALLHISRDEDPFYPVAVASTFADRLRERAKDVEFHMIAGPHRFPSKAAGIVQPWLKRVFG